MSATCRSCAAPIVWATTELGRRIPLDAEPAPFERGLFELVDGVAISRPPLVLYRSHFATCPNADEHRRPKPSTPVTTSS